MISRTRLSDVEARPIKKRKIDDGTKSSVGQLSGTDLPKSNATNCRPVVTRKGKISRITLPQEYTLEALVSRLSVKPECWTTETPACEWTGVYCDEGGNVESIHWSWTHLVGSLDFEHIPATVKEFEAFYCDLSGDVSFANIATGSCLHSCVLSDNALTGSLDLTLLPGSMNVLNLMRNFLTDCICLVTLPPNLVELKLSYNVLSGKLVLTKLPGTLKELLLDHNAFEGNVDLHQLPRVMTHLFLHENKKLRGNLRVAKLPVGVLDHLEEVWMGTCISLE